jgi:hypothetical protein
VPVIRAPDGALLADRSVPGPVRVVLFGLLAWLVNPINLIPEFVPVLGRSTTSSSRSWSTGTSVAGWVRKSSRRPGTADGYDLLAGTLG